MDDKHHLFESKRKQKESGTVTQQSKEQPDTSYMANLESEESAAQRRNQPGPWLKILAPNQMLSRLPISLAHLKAGNNFQNEIRQILYSLCRSKKHTKQFYKSLIGII